jgi:hypothetical protein
MSQLMQSSSPLKNNYEKYVLLILLLILIGSCAWLVLAVIDQRGVNDNYVANTKIGGATYTVQDTTGFERMLASARDTASKPLEHPERSFVSEERVACVKCGKPIPYSALNCPFCLQAQPEIIDADTIDTDGDGITDKVELELGLNPQDPSDAHNDLDGDGFTNLEELQAGTDPQSNKSMPDPIVKLRVLAVKPIPFYLRFVSESTFADGSMRFQLNMQSQSAPTLFVKLNDIAMGYQVTKFDPNGKDGPTLTLVRVADKRVVNLVRGRPVTENELAIKFVFLIDRTALPVKRLNDVFELRGKQYKVIDIKSANVVIQDVATMKKINVPKITEAERTGASAPAAAPSGPAAGGNGAGGDEFIFGM